MKSLFSLVLIFSWINFSFAQEKTDEETSYFTYLDLKEEFDLVVDFTMVNPECASKQQNFYSTIIGTTVIEDKIERITVMVPCLGNEFVQGDLITIKPIKTPKKNIVYTIRNYKKDGQEFSDALGAEFRATWGEVVDVL